MPQSFKDLTRQDVTEKINKKEIKLQIIEEMHIPSRFLFEKLYQVGYRY